MAEVTSREDSTGAASAFTQIDIATISIDTATEAAETLGALIAEGRLGVNETCVFLGGIVAELQRARSELEAASDLLRESKHQQ